MNASRMLAPRVPIRYPMMFPMMMMAAVNSMLRFFFMQMISAMAIVRIVRSSSSSTPAIRQLRATMACSNAKTWMIHDGFVFLNMPILPISSPKLGILLR